MIYEWDEEKYQSNLKKHGLKFEDAIEVFHDLNALELLDEHEHEDRFKSI